jgi:RNA polymerase sigma-70 factor (ECF subfamily)
MFGGMLIPSDEWLVRRFLRGDGTAFEQIVERYTPALFNLAYRLTQDRGEAEQVVQDSFLRALGAMGRVRTDQPLKPWLLQIALNLCRTLHAQRRPLTFGELSRDEDETFDVVDDSPLPYDWVELSETRELVRRALAGLPPSYRAVLTLRYNEDLTYEDIAQVLELPINTVRTHLFRAKELLRLRLAAWLKENPDGLPDPRAPNRLISRQRPAGRNKGEG